MDYIIGSVLGLLIQFSGLSPTDTVEIKCENISECGIYIKREGVGKESNKGQTVDVNTYSEEFTE